MTEILDHSPIRLVLLENQALLRDGITRLVRSEATLSLLAAAGTRRLLFATRFKTLPHVMVVTEDVTDESLVVCLTSLRTRWPEACVVLLTDKESLKDAWQANPGLVEGYASKRLGFYEFRQVIGAVIDTKRAVRQSESRLLLANRNGQALSVKPLVLRGSSTLTDREREILTHLALGRTVKETAELLGIATTTVDNHKTRIMRKINVHSKVALTHFAIREGMVSL